MKIKVDKLVDEMVEYQLCGRWLDCVVGYIHQPNDMLNYVKVRRLMKDRSR